MEFAGGNGDHLHLSLTIVVCEIFTIPFCIEKSGTL